MQNVDYILESASNTAKFTCTITNVSESSFKPRENVKKDHLHVIAVMLLLLFIQLSTCWMKSKVFLVCECCR